MFKPNTIFWFLGKEILLMPIHQSDGYWLHVYGDYDQKFVDLVSDELGVYIEGSSKV